MYQLFYTIWKRSNSRSSSRKTQGRSTYFFHWWNEDCPCHHCWQCTSLQEAIARAWWKEPKHNLRWCRPEPGCAHNVLSLNKKTPLADFQSKYPYSSFIFISSVRSSFANQGEICLCGSRIFVQKGIYDKFLANFVEQTKKLVVCLTYIIAHSNPKFYWPIRNSFSEESLFIFFIKVGDPNEETSHMGALISKEHLSKVQYYVDLAKEEGGTIVYGGNRPELKEELKGGMYMFVPSLLFEIARRMWGPSKCTVLLGFISVSNIN